jgi:hypothetical protein
MSATKDPNAALGPLPDVVAITTPHGEKHIGEVVDTFWQADAGQIDRWYVVDVDGSTFRRPADEVGSPSDV